MNNLEIGDKALIRSKDSVLAEHDLKPGDRCVITDTEGGYCTVVAENPSGRRVQLKVAHDELMPLSAPFPPEAEAKDLRSRLAPQKVSF